MAKKQDLLEPKARSAMDKLKLEVADETLGRDMKEPITARNYESALEQKKWEVAGDLDMKDKIEQVGWENMTTQEVGKIGGHVGGKIGGNMVKELIAKAESQMAPVADEAIDKEAVEKTLRGG
ncbi:MAG TPA: small, acid-soluble spore protein, alpha/beta type [Selenomonadales bacterium]|nr:small, acid-soluble spore protein, alpha/beta type [Selenomonadales bacterium]